jgi:hypothetical protein
VTDRPTSEADQPAPARLPHLSGPGAAARQALAAHFLRGCPHILEIGGAGLPITSFLTHAPESVTVFDPKIEPFLDDELVGRPCRVRHIASKFQGNLLAFGASPYGVVLLGLSLKPFGRRAALDEALLDLLCDASVVVIEYSLALPRAVEQSAALVESTSLRLNVAIDLEITDGVLETWGHARRRMLVLGPSPAGQ